MSLAQWMVVACDPKTGRTSVQFEGSKESAVDLAEKLNRIFEMDTYVGFLEHRLYAKRDRIVKP